MLIGIGCDILKISRIEKEVQNPDSLFIKKLFSENEKKLIASRSEPLYSYATRFAGKEAVFKTFGVPQDACRLNDIEILENEAGQPFVVLHGKALTIAQKKKIAVVQISLSFETDYAVAFAAALA